MRIQTTAKLITGLIYEKKDKETGEKTGEKGMMVNLLIDTMKDFELSGKVISPMISNDYLGEFDLSNYKRFEDVFVDLDVPVGNKGLFILHDMKKV